MSYLLKIIALIFCLLNVITVSSQYPKEIQEKLKGLSTEDRIGKLHQLGYNKMVAGECPLAKKLIQEALDLSISIGSIEKEGSNRLLLAKLYFYNHPETKNNQLAVEQILLALDLKYENENQLRAPLFALLASIFNESGAYQKGLENQRIAYNIYKEKESGYSLFLCLGGMAHSFQMLEQYDSVTLYYKEQIEVAKKSSNDGLVYHAYNNLGVGYKVAGKLDSALYSYEKALTLWHLKEKAGRSDSLMYGFIHGNIASVYEKWEEYEQALEFLEIDYNMCKSYGTKTNIIHTGTQYASLLIMVGELRDARKLLDELWELAIQEEDYKQLMELSREYATLFKEKEQTSRELEYKQLQLLYQDSLQKLELEKQQTSAEAVANYLVVSVESQLKLKDLEAEKANQALENEKRNLENSQLWIVISSTAALLVIAILYIIYQRIVARRNRQIQLQKLRQIQSEKVHQNLKETIASKNKDLTNLAIEIGRKHDFSTEIMSKVKAMRPMDEDSKLKKLDLLKFIREHMHIDENYKVLQENIDKVNERFFQNLRQRFPSLTHNEMQVCALVRLKLSNKEIATIKNVTPKAIKMSKYRLRKKFDLPPEENFVVFLESF